MPGARHRCVNILIAHQGGIPAYRIPFYNLLEELRPDHWRFHVINDASAKTGILDGHSQSYSFPVINAPVQKGPFNLKFQNFLSHVRKADVLILDTHLSNLGYILAASVRPKHCPLILWGHTHNMNLSREIWIGRFSRRLKTRYLKSCDMFLAYTAGQSAAAMSVGLCKSKIKILNNTIDIEAHRARFQRLSPQRHQLRQTLGIDESCKVLLVVGRLVAERRVEFLCDSFRQLAVDKTYRLIVIGDGPHWSYVQKLQQELPCGQVIAPGAATSPDMLSQYYVAADAFIMPGAVGLAPLEAICYDLNVFAFDLPSHGPEFEYLTAANSVILPQSTTPAQCASSIDQWFSRRQSTPPSPYETISHLRLEAMVRNYIEAVQEVLTSR